MGKDPYTSPVPYTAIGSTVRRQLIGYLVAVSGRSSDSRGLVLIPQPTRVICRYQIHELMTTDEAEAAPGKEVNRISVVGWFEVIQGTSLIADNPVYLNGRNVGSLAGFDDTHAPNHYNLVVRTPSRFSGLYVGLKVGDEVRIGEALTEDQGKGES